MESNISPFVIAVKACLPFLQTIFILGAPYVKLLNVLLNQLYTLCLITILSNKRIVFLWGFVRTVDRMGRHTGPWILLLNLCGLEKVKNTTIPPFTILESNRLLLVTIFTYKNLCFSLYALGFRKNKYSKTPITYNSDDSK